MHILKNAKGLSIVEVLVAAGIMTIIMAGFTSMLMSQNKETKALSEVLASFDLQKTLVGSLSDGTVCGYVLNNPTAIPFNSTALPFTIVLPANRPLYAGVSGGVPTVPVAQVNAAASPFAKSLVVKEIKLTITSGSGNKFFGQWQIDFDPALSVRAHKPAIIGTVLTANITTPTAATVTGCMGDLTAGVAQACTASELMRGFDNTGAIICEPVDAKFLKLDGTNSMSGNLNMANRNIVGAGTASFAQGELTNTAVIGAACASASGTFTKISTGGLVSCQSGIWKTAQAAVGKQIVANAIASYGNSSTVGGVYSVNGSGLITRNVGSAPAGPQCTLSNSTGKCTVGTCPIEAGLGFGGGSNCTIYTPTVDGLVTEKLTRGACSMAGCVVNSDTNSVGWTN